MSQHPHAVYFDIDGTILGESGRITQHVLDAISALRKRDIAIGIATGRPWFAAQPIARQIKANAPCVSYSGALITSPHNEHPPLYQAPLQSEDAAAVLHLAKEENWYLELYTPNRYFVEQRTHLSTLHAHYLHSLPEECSLSEVLDEELLKAVLIFEGDIPTNALQQLQEVTKDTELAIAYGAAHPELQFVNVTDHRAKRLVALEKVCSELHCKPDQIMSFGDGEADLPFLTNVRWGVAMGNAPLAVRQQAPFTAGHVEENGVATFLTSFLSS
jgi:Cof subfamily protein (haloacid dehalogenase superfamily)